MPDATKDMMIETDLLSLLADKFPEIEVTVAHSERWSRMCVTFRWPGFAGLLNEERFQKLTSAIPDSFRADHMRGFVWLELTLEQSIEEYLAQPRSEDVADRAEDIYAGLLKSGFFVTLEQTMQPAPETKCGGDFAQVACVLQEKDYPQSEITNAKLLFISHGAYCDCQVVQTVQAQLAQSYANVA